MAMMAIVVLPFTGIISPGFADETLESDAYVRTGADDHTWIIGNAALEFEFQFTNSAFRLTGFRNKLCPTARNYVDPAAARAPFLADQAGGFQTEVVWAKSLRGQQEADPAADHLQIVMQKGDLIGFGVNAAGDGANSDSTEWITKVVYNDGEGYASSEDTALDQGPIWYYCIHARNTRFLEYLDTVERVSAGTQYNAAGQPIAGTEPKQVDAAAERIRCTSTYTPYRLPSFAPFVNATRLQPSWIVDAMRVWRAPKDGTVTISGRAQPARGNVDIQIIRFREPPAGSEKTLGSAGNWRLDGSEARQVNFGGRPAAQLNVNLSKETLRAHYHVIAYPGASLLRHWVELENTGTVPFRISSADHFSLCLPASTGPLTHYWMFGGDSRSNSGLLQSAEVSGAYHKATIGYMTDWYTPWLAMFRSDPGEGWFMAPEYNTLWIFSVDQDASGRVTVSASLPELAGHELAPGAQMPLPTITFGVFRDSLDDMARRVYDWQYEYLWDFTNDEWYARMPILSDWYNDVHNLQENFAGRLGDLDMVTTDIMRSIGSTLLWDDAGWSESPNIWTPTWNGPDYSNTTRYLSKSGMSLLLWHCGWPDAGILDTEVGRWGDFQWRTDSSNLPNIATQERWYRQITTFLARHPRSSFHTCSGGSRYAHTFDIQRYADLNMLTDGGGGAQTNYYLSYLETPDKWTDIIPVALSGGKYFADTTRQILTMVPNWALAYRPMTEDVEQARRVFEIYRYLTLKGVAGRRSYSAHPLIKGDDEYYYSQRLSHDRRRACIILKHRAPKAVIIYPRELLPDHTYVVGLDSTPSVTARSGADLMANGITIAHQPPGELIYLGLPDRPGAGTDKTPPTAPGAALARRETHLGHTGIGVYWSPGTDNNLVSYYEIRRGEAVLGKVSAGTCFFDHTPGWDSQAQYQVRTVDGDGNASGWIQAKSAVDEPLTFSALGGHFPTAGRDGWYAETSVTGRSFEPMTFVPPLRDPGGDYGGTGNQPGGVEGYWEGAGTARCGRGWQQAALNAQSIRKWIAPRAGKVRILGRAAKEYYRLHKGAALRVRIMHQEAQIWPATGWKEVPLGDVFGCPHDVTVDVAVGDTIRFVLDRGSDPDNDIVAWMPRLVYTDPENAPSGQDGGSVVRLLCGSSQSYVDSLGNTWLSDRYFSSGKAMEPGRIDTSRMPTQDDLELYGWGREGREFTYTIPVKPGLYTIRLLFAETHYLWSFERPLNLSINGCQVLRNFDVCQAAHGPRCAYARVFRSQVPDGNGDLELRFTGGFDPLQESAAAMVQAIEVLPEIKPAVRIDAGADKEHIDWNSRVWGRDAGYEGGQVLSSESPVDQASPTLYDQRLYQTARSGRKFAYKIAVPPGLYAVHLKFAELWLPESGRRPMNIEINGRGFWTQWDPAAAAGKLKMAMDLRAEDISPDHNGIITVRISAAGPNDAILQGLEIE